MQSLLKSDIFFVVTTVCVVLVALLVAIALIYIVRILRDLKKLSKKIDHEGEKIVDDIADMRESVKGTMSRFSWFGGKKQQKDRNNEE